MVYTRTDFTREFVDSLIRKHGDATAAAKAIAHQCRGDRAVTVTAKTVRLWMSEVRSGVVHSQHPLFSPAESGVVTKFLDLWRKTGIDPAKVDEGEITINAGDYKTWGVFGKVKHHIGETPNGKPIYKEELETKSLYSIGVKVQPQWEKGPTWPVVQPSPPVKLVYQKQNNRPGATGIQTVVVLGDEQIGFLRNPLNLSELLPMHDEAAMDVAVQIIEAVQPKQVVHLGDLIDLSEMSRFLQVEEFFRTTQPAVDAAYQFLARCESAAGDPKNRTRTVFLKGNHERRMAEYVQKNARAAFRLRPAMETPASWPDMSLARLLRFEELGIEETGEWPGGEAWLTDSLVVRHEPPANKSDFDASVIYGHQHRARRESFTRQTSRGPVTHTAYGVGCLCRLDRNPDKGSLMRTRVASDRGYTNWQQGLAVVFVDTKTKQHHVEHVDIVNGTAIFNGRVFSARKAA